MSRIGWLLGNVAILVCLGSGVADARAQAATTAQPDSAVGEPQESPVEAQSEFPAASHPDSVSIGLSREDLFKPTVSPTRAVLMTPVFPGWGQLYTKSSWRAAVAFGVEMFYLSSLLMNERLAARNQEFADGLEPGSSQRELYDAIAKEHGERALDFIWWTVGGLLIIALDAYVGAHLFQFDDDTVPVPNRWGELTAMASAGPGKGDMTPSILLFQWRIPF